MAIITHRCAVLGAPIAHSLSPTLHAAAYRALGLDSWSYTRRYIEEDALSGFLQSLDSSWRALSLTMPLKLRIQQFGAPCDRWSHELHVSNTAIFRYDGDGRRHIDLYNTDVEGIRLAFRHAWQLRIAANKPAYSRSLNGDSMQDDILHTRINDLEAFDNVAQDNDAPSTDTRGINPLHNVSTSNDIPVKVVILGNGNTALSACAAISTMVKRSHITVASRGAHSGPAIDEFVASRRGCITLSTAELEQCVDPLLDADIIVSTLPAHVADPIAKQLAYAASSHCLQVRGTLLNVAYDPRPSMLNIAWKQFGGISIGGEEMLLYQAVEQVRLMTGMIDEHGSGDSVDVLEDAMRTAMSQSLGESLFTSRSTSREDSPSLKSPISLRAIEEQTL
jgi:shikimate dehydrogenase